jgi:hypothetical protein
MGWYAALHRLPQHGLLNFALFEPQGLLPRPLFLLLSLVFFGFRGEPVLHAAIFGALP